MSVVWLQSWLEDDEGYIRHDGWCVYTTLEKALELTKKRDKDMNGPGLVSIVVPDGDPFPHDVLEVVYKRAKEHEGFYVEFLEDLKPKN